MPGLSSPYAKYYYFPLSNTIIDLGGGLHVEPENGLVLARVPSVVGGHEHAGEDVGGGTGPAAQLLLPAVHLRPGKNKL